MKLLGLTGGIGMGKSTCAKLLRERGVAVVDTDDLARDVVQPGQPALAEIVEAFGAQMVDADRRLRREELAKVVFADPTARKRLEAITHPRIRELWRQQVQDWRGQGVAVAVVVIPLLYETQAESEFDAVVCVACAAPTQRERLLARGWTPGEIDGRVTAQLSVADKIGRARYVIWTEGSVELHQEQLHRVLAR